MNIDITAIVASGIGAFVSLFIFIWSTIATNINNKKPNKLKVQKAQLHKLFEPLMIMLENVDYSVTPGLLDNIGDLIYSNFAITPPKLFKEYKSLLCTAESSPRTVFIIKDITITNYNWLRKQLNYPYEKNLINMFCLEKTEYTAMLFQSLLTPTLLTSIVFIFSFGFTAISLYIDITSQLYLKTLGIMFLIGFFAFWIMDNISFIRKTGSLYKQIYKKANNNPPENKKIEKSGVAITYPTAIDGNGENTGHSDDG